MSRRFVLIAPGRGTYTRAELGCVRRAVDSGGPPLAALLRRADELRRERGRPAISELDAAQQYKASLHQAGEHASGLIFTAAAIDARAAAEHIEKSGGRIAAVTGNSMGWYTALHIAGALSFEDAFSIVETMGWRQKGSVIGAQAIVPIVDEDWRPDPAREAAVFAAIDQVSSQPGRWVGLSIRLGGFLVLAGTRQGIEALLPLLPAIKLGERAYPFIIPLHSAFHSALMRPAAEEGRELGLRISWQPLTRPLIDGRGAQLDTLGAASHRELRAYTFGHQVLEPYDFTAALRVALRDFAPDQVILLGPGSTLGSAVAQVMIAEDWRGIGSKADFLKAQEDPKTRPLVALGRADQRRDFFAL